MNRSTPLRQRNCTTPKFNQRVALAARLSCRPACAWAGRICAFTHGSSGWLATGWRLSEL